MQLDTRQTLVLAIAVLFLGKYLIKRIPILQEYNIPEPVVGGLLASLVFGAIYFIFDTAIQFSLQQRDTLLVIFFTTIGLSARFTTLIKGGKTLVILLVFAVAYLFMQNFTGIFIAAITGLDNNIGVIGGSVSLSGGHGTAIAWSPKFIEQYHISNALEIGVACATFGLILGGIIGGPIAKILIQRHKLEAPRETPITVGFKYDEHGTINVDSMLTVLLIIALAIGAGLHLHMFIESLGIHLPVFVSCLFGGILLSNTVPYLLPKLRWSTGTPTLALVSDLSLGLFLAMSLMSLQLWTLVDLALPILLLLAAQTLVIILFTVFIIFRVLGKTYDAAVISSGYAGLALGATPTAIANMEAVTKKYGAAPKAFIVIPLIGAFFVDIANAVIIKTALVWIN